MNKYDGPSFFRKNNPKIESIKQNPKKKTADKKESWLDKENYFESIYEENLPKNIKTRADLQKEAADYIKTPPAHLNKKEFEAQREPEKAPVKPRRSTQKRPTVNRSGFQKKHVPASLQKLDGWKSRVRNVELLDTLEERLQKDEDSYLLFADNLADEVKEEEKKPKPKQKQKNQSEQNKKTKRAILYPKNSEAELKEKLAPTPEEKAERVQEDIKKDIRKSPSGLNRSLSRIIAEDQEAIENGKNNLGSLFSENTKD